MGHYLGHAAQVVPVDAGDRLIAALHFVLPLVGIFFVADGDECRVVPHAGLSAICRHSGDLYRVALADHLLLQQKRTSLPGSLCVATTYGRFAVPTEQHRVYHGSQENDLMRDGGMRGGGTRRFADFLFILQSRASRIRSTLTAGGCAGFTCADATYIGRGA